MRLRGHRGAVYGPRRRRIAALLQAPVAIFVVAVVGFAVFGTIAKGAPAPGRAAASVRTRGVTARSAAGYWMLGGDGVVYGFGAALADTSGVANAAAMTGRHDGSGYWVTTSAGAVFAHGTSKYAGGSPTLLPGESVSTISSTPSGKGYWLFSNRGRVFPYGDAKAYGDLAGTALNGPIVASAATPTGHGYYLVGSDGGVFAFGDARFRGSMGGRPLAAPIVGIAPTPDNLGYWEVGSDGGVFSFQAPFRGSMGGRPLNRPVRGLVAFGNGYLMVASDGGVFDFSNKPFFGSLSGHAIGAPIVGIAAFADSPAARPSVSPPPGDTNPSTTDTTVGSGSTTTNTTVRSTTTTRATTTTTRATTTTTVAPPPSGFPTPQTTGWAPTGVTLTPYTGPSTITTNGTVIDGADIPFALVIQANNVTITRSRIVGVTADSYVVEQMGGHTGLLLRNVEVAPKTVTDHPDRAVASFGTNMTLDHVYVHGTQRGIQTGDYTTVQDSYSDNFYNSTQNHATAVMSLGGTAHVVLLHNAFGCDTGECSSAMSVYPQTNFGGPNDDWTITQNLFNGGSYCVYLGYSPADGESPNTNMHVTNNYFGVKYHTDCGLYGPVGSWFAGTGDTWTGNVWYAPGTAKNGQAVSGA